jgi:ribosomal protein L14E/L6E/L27E
METTSDITIGQMVKSKAGRDKGNIFIVVDVLDDEYVLIADGDIRKLDNPKKKKVKHLIVYNTISYDIKEKIENKQKFNNAFIRKQIEPFKKEL